MIVVPGWGGERDWRGGCLERGERAFLELGNGHVLVLFWLSCDLLLLSSKKDLTSSMLLYETRLSTLFAAATKEREVHLLVFDHRITSLHRERS